MTNTEVYTEATIPPSQTDNDVTVVATTYRRSPTIGKIALALAKAQGEIKNATKDSSNPFYKSKYADLAACRETYYEALAKYEVALIQFPTLDDNRVRVTTLLAHSSGEFFESDLEMPMDGKLNAQEEGKAISYARRYSVQAVLGLAAEDDDGNSASGKKDGNGGNQTQRATQQQSTTPQGGKVTSIGQHKIPEKPANVESTTPEPEPPKTEEKKIDPNADICNQLQAKAQAHLNITDPKQFTAKVLRPFCEGWMGIPWDQRPKEPREYVPIFGAIEKLTRDEKTRTELLANPKTIGDREAKQFFENQKAS